MRVCPHYLYVSVVIAAKESLINSRLQVAKLAMSLLAPLDLLDRPTDGFQARFNVREMDLHRKGDQ